MENLELTCNRHLILSPGAIMTVVKTPANIPAFPICKSLYYKNTENKVCHSSFLQQKQDREGKGSAVLCELTFSCGLKND